mgnify:CR=1 FL=1
MKTKNFDLPVKPVEKEILNHTTARLINFSPPKRDFANLPKNNEIKKSRENTQNVHASETVTMALGMSWRIF